MRYVDSKFRRYGEEFTYRVYVTSIMQSLAKGLGAKKVASYYDLVRPLRSRDASVVIDTRTGDEIANDIMNRVNRFGKRGEE